MRKNLQKHCQEKWQKNDEKVIKTGGEIVKIPGKLRKRSKTPPFPCWTENDGKLILKFKKKFNDKIWNSKKNSKVYYIIY